MQSIPFTHDKGYKWQWNRGSIDTVDDQHVIAYASHGCLCHKEGLLSVVTFDWSGHHFTIGSFRRLISKMVDYISILLSFIAKGGGGTWKCWWIPCCPCNLDPCGRGQHNNPLLQKVSSDELRSLQLLQDEAVGPVFAAKEKEEWLPRQRKCGSIQFGCTNR